MKLTDKVELSRSEWENIIDEWIFSERDRRLIKRRLLDGILIEPLAEEFDLSVVQTQKIICKNQEILFKRANKMLTKQK